MGISGMRRRWPRAMKYTGLDGGAIACLAASSVPLAREGSGVPSGDGLQIRIAQRPHRLARGQERQRRAVGNQAAHAGLQEVDVRHRWCRGRKDWGGSRAGAHAPPSGISARPCRATRTGRRIRMKAIAAALWPQVTPSRFGVAGAVSGIQEAVMERRRRSSAGRSRWRWTPRCFRLQAEARLGRVLFDHEVPAGPAGGGIVGAARIVHVEAEEGDVGSDVAAEDRRIAAGRPDVA